MATDGRHLAAGEQVNRLVYPCSGLSNEKERNYSAMKTKELFIQATP